MKKKYHSRIGLALGAGGARGLVHIGVLQSFSKLDIPVNLISGTSIGAVIGAMYAATLDTDWVANHFREFIQSDLYKSIGLDRISPSVHPEHSIFQVASKYVKEYITYTVANERMGLLKSERLHNIMEYLIPVKTFEELKIPFKCLAVDLNTGKDLVFSNGDLITAVTASSAIPGYLTPVKIGNNLLSDGGISQPIPLKLMSSMGADFIIAVDVGIHKFSPLEPTNLMKLIGRADMIASSRLIDHMTSSADILIRPDTENLFWSEFNRIDSLIKNGYDSACNHIDEIKSKLQIKITLGGRLSRFFKIGRNIKEF